MSFNNAGRQARDSQNLERNISNAVNTNETSPGNVLTRMFWQMFTDDFTIANKAGKWHSLMELWVTDQTGKAVSSNSRSTARGNAAKEFLKPRFSWNVFIKGMKFQRKRRLVMTLEAYDEQGNVSKVVTEMDLRNFGNDEEELAPIARNWLSALDKQPEPNYTEEEYKKKTFYSENGGYKKKPSDAEQLLAKMKKDANGQQPRN